MIDFSTWDRATIEQFAQEATDKLNLRRELLVGRDAEIERLRQRVKHLESENQLAWNKCGDAEAELAELRKAQGEPVAVVNVQGGGVKPVVSWLRAEQLPAGSHKLYTSAPSIPEGWQLVPVEAISTLLAQAMDQAVANGANSVSMPDEYVEIAVWLASAPKHTKKAK